MKLAIILGTRPEIIKMAPIIRECEERKTNYFIIHSGQHYSENMDKVFFDEFNLPTPKYNLNVGIHPYNKQIARMIAEISQILLEEKADVILVEGDTNTVLAAALAAKKIGISVAHHEAGLRSNDLRMLEEVNRIVTDHISDHLFSPTRDAIKNLHEEGFPGYKIVHTGNTIVDAVKQGVEIAKNKINIFEKFNLERKKYILMTAHRAENVDIKESLQGILQGASLVQKELRIPIIYPIHHRTKAKIKEFGLQVPENIIFVEPLSFLELLQLEEGAKLVLTDSGGLQEEACTLGVPCVTLRISTERPETIMIGANMIAGTNPDKILECSKIMINKEYNWENPFGEGNASKKIIDFLIKKYNA